MIGKIEWRGNRRIEYKSTKYEVGDKIRIKCWRTLELQFNTNFRDEIVVTFPLRFNEEMERQIERLNTYRVVTVESAHISYEGNPLAYYYVEELDFPIPQKAIESKIIPQEEEPPVEEEVVETLGKKKNFFDYIDLE